MNVQLAHLGMTTHGAAVRLDGTYQGVRDRVGATVAQHHPHGLAAKAGEIGKDGTAGNVGGKIEVQAPRGQSGLQTGIVEMPFNPLPG